MISRFRRRPSARVNKLAFSLHRRVHPRAPTALPRLPSNRAPSTGQVRRNLRPPRRVPPHEEETTLQSVPLCCFCPGADPTRRGKAFSLLARVANFSGRRPSSSSEARFLLKVGRSNRRANHCSSLFPFFAFPFLRILSLLAGIPVFQTLPTLLNFRLCNRIFHVGLRRFSFSSLAT